MCVYFLQSKKFNTMTFSLRSVVLLPLAAAYLVGCSSSSDSPASGTSTPGPDGGDPPTVLTKFNGTYLEACAVADELFPEDGSEVTTIVISGDSASTTILSYTDAACTIPDIPAEAVLTLSIAYPGGTVVTDMGTADFVDITTESILIDGVAPSAAQLATFDVLGTTYDIALLNGSSLFLGDDTGELDGESAETRPDTLLPTSLIRQ